ncbi:MAG TPA: lamin tail domain-containing protein [Anaerolineae bacterium]
MRYIYLPDGTFVNAELVRQGYAQVATFPPDVKHQELFLSLQAEARAAGLGLWDQTVAQVAPSATPQPPPTALPTAAPTQPPPTNSPMPEPTSQPAPTDPPPAPTDPPAAPGNVQITSIFFDGAVTQVESDEYAVITNQGGAAVNLAGWRLNAGDPGQDFVFPAFDLQPGQSCRVYTNESPPETCGFSFGRG